MDGSASFGYWLRRQRKALDLTQGELARQVGCSEATIRKIEADERRPSRQIAERLADLLALASTDRAAFLQAARAEVGADRLALPRQPAEMPSASPPQPAYPSGTVTFLFTDIEHSTQLWACSPDAMPQALARHDAIIRAAIEAHGGVVFGTAGDAFCAAFDNATRGLATALAAQRALLVEPWDRAGLPTEQPLRVRMALHSAVAELHNSGYRGQPLNRIARLLEAGHGGQILLSAPTWELVRDEVPSDIELRSLGTHRLKDLTRPEQIIQVVAPGLPADVPPLRTLDARPHNLPAQTTPLIGREHEVAALQDLLRQADVRLLTLTGTGGAGKTRLGLQAAAEVLDAFADGVFFVALAAIQDAALVPAAVAQALGLREAGDHPLLEQLHAMLRHRQTLVVLDNFEQVAGAAPLVSSLLEAAPALKILVTSRVPLHLYGEHEFVVPPLELPDLRKLPPLERLTQYAAVQLFIARAQAVKPDFAVTNASAPAVAEICHRLDGLPLAIELAAARSKLFSPPLLLARLGSRLALLTGGPRDRPARHQTLRAAIDWSYQLLSPSEQTLFARLGVFVGGWTVEAAQEVCHAGQDLSMDTLDGLLRLVDHSLVRQDEETGGELRCVMLETIREYALERLAASGEEEIIHRRHTMYYLGLVERAESELHGKEQKLWFGRLQIEHDNLRAALLRVLEQGDGELALRMSGALGYFWLFQGYLGEGRRWLETALARDPSVQAEVRTKGLRAAGILAWKQGDYVGARALQEERLALQQELGNREGIAFALNDLGLVVRDQGECDLAIRLFEESLALFQNIRNQIGISFALGNLGGVAERQGNYERAKKFYHESLVLSQEGGNKWSIAVALFSYGHVAQQEGDCEEAKEFFRESLILSQELGAIWLIPEIFEGFARVALAQSNLARATQLFGVAEALREVIGAPLPSVDRPAYKRDIIAIKTELDEATYNAAWAEGRAMTLEQAIAYACKADA